jgi:anti-sigma regulatory factor (Ser/Thr protein kinase)
VEATWEARHPGQGFVHQALIYDSDEEFMNVGLPFVESAIEAREPTLVAVQAANVENLRASLGGEVLGVELLSVEQWYENSARTRDKFASWVAEHATGGRVRLMGEPPWATSHEAQVRDFARYEAVLNVAFEGLPLTFICPYDARVLPAEIVGYARRTHPEIVSAGGPTVSDSYEDPKEFCRRLDSAALAPLDRPSVEIDFGLTDLPSVRRMVEWEALYAGLGPSRADELVLAVNEIATNAVVHGRAPTTLRVWSENGEVVCEVSDSGDGIDDVLAGQLRPAAMGLGGRGIWLTRMMSDAVEIRSNGPGCTVAIHATAPARTPEMTQKMA